MKVQDFSIRFLMGAVSAARLGRLGTSWMSMSLLAYSGFNKIGSVVFPPEGKDYKWYISGIYCRGIICYLPPSKGTRNLLGQWLNFKLLGDDEYLVGKISRSNFFFQGPGRLSELTR